ncbi:MAG: translation initiation factor IF-3 [Acidobacteria bacterium]|nr:translation initiation factor IF-3 [Acidobacteriota bacterium]MCB9398686.1 translation initiation factor IF-3 [Acidobacteriota bacterium]
MKPKKDVLRVNEAIDAPQVRVIGGEGGQVGILTIQEALRMAEESGMDLVEVSPDAEPPVCRILDYGKFRFQQNKKQQDARRKQKTIQVKEVKFRPRIDDHDYMTKQRHIRKFLEAGHKVRALVAFRGREMVHRELGLKILERLIGEITDIGIIEKDPQMEGRQMFMMVAPIPPANKK